MQYVPTKSPLLLIGILRLGEVLDILLEGLVIGAGLFDELSVLGSPLLQILDLLVQLHEGG
jgi:hypothetical protein